MKGQDYIVKTIPQYLNLVHQIQNKEDMCWFRGHTDVRYKLVPTLYRDKELIRTTHSDNDFKVCSLNTTRATKPYKFAKNQRKAFEQFKKDGLAFVQQPPANDFEWLVLMQHYGGNTQLLDWTSNPLISLYFALSGLKNHGNKQNKNHLFEKSLKTLIKDAVNNDEWINTYQLEFYDYSDFAVVYIINPLSVNDAHLRISNKRIILDSSEKYRDIVDCYVNYSIGYDNDYPICIEAPKYDRRAYIQGSAFTLHGYYIDGLDWFNTTRNGIYKIFIPNKNAVAMHDDLRSIYGVTHSFVYQDLSNVVKDCYET